MSVFYMSAFSESVQIQEEGVAERHKGLLWYKWVYTLAAWGPVSFYRGST